MLAVIALLTALAVVALTLLLLQLAPGRAGMANRLEELHTMGGGTQEVLARRRRQERSARLKNVLQAMGERMEAAQRHAGPTRQFLMQAGYPEPGAVPIYWATRVSMAVGLALAALLLVPLLKLSALQVLMGVVWGATLGWIFPAFYVRSKLK